ncbi:MAG TPA: hypothetical protein VFC63_14440 [Blastocatellia bacterium]|nr:hypothetical protein [Blastocatellia bacterium]
MKRFILAVGLTLPLSVSLAFGQSAGTNSNTQTNSSVKTSKAGASTSTNQQTDANAQRKGGKASANGSSSQNSAANANVGNDGLGLDSGSQIDAVMQSTLDSKHATQGQQFLMKTNKDVKAHGQTVIKKGSTLVGHVVNAQSKAEGNGNGSLLLAIDGVQQGNTLIPLQANFVGMVRQTVQSTADTEMIGAPMSGPAPRSGGGLVGGVGSTVNSTVGATTSTVGGVTNTTGSVGGAVNSTVNGTASGVGNLGGTVNGATQTVFSLGNNTVASTSSSVAGATQFTRKGGDLKLDKGSEFLLAVTGSATATGSIQR